MDEEQNVFVEGQTEEVENGQPLTQKEREIQNNINTHKNAAEVAIATKNPYAMAIGYGYKALDNITDGESSKYIAQKNRMFNKIAPGGRQMQRLSNKSSESGIGDKVGQIASIKSSFSKGGGGKPGVGSKAGAASNVAPRTEKVKKAENAAEKLKNLSDKTSEDKGSNDNKKATLGSVLKKGGKNIWKKLPPMVKLYIVFGAVFVALLFLVIAFVSSFNPLQLIFLGEQEYESEEKYKEEFYLFCGTEEECSNYEWLKNGKLIADQFKFYNKLNKLVNATNIASWDNTMEKNRIKAILVTTLSLDVSFDEFVAGSDGAFNVNDNLNFWDELGSWVKGSQFSQDMDDLDYLYFHFLAYAPVCNYKVDGVKKREYMKQPNGTIHYFNLWEKVVLNHIYDTDGLVNQLIGLITGNDGFSIAAYVGVPDINLRLSGVSEETIKLKQNCESMDSGVFSIEHSTTSEISEMNFWDHLLNSNYLDTRSTLESRYIEYATRNGLDYNNRRNWDEKDLKAVRAEIISDIQTIVDSYYDVQKGDAENQTYSLNSNNGITVEGVGTMSLDNYVMGVLYGEFGNLIIGQPEAAKVAAIAVRTFALENTNYLSRAIGNGETVQVYKEVPTSYNGYSELKAAVDSTSGEMLVNSNSGRASGGHYITIPIGSHRVENSDGTVTMHMQGVPGDDRTNYSYTMSWDDIHRIAASSGGLYNPTDDSHHWGISVYALREMAEKGMTYQEIIEQTYGVGGVLELKETVYHENFSGLSLNSTSSFWMRYSPADPAVGNPYYDFNRFNYGECAWYAMERADEILSTMGWYKTRAWMLNDGVGGNGGDYCSSAAYAGYDHYTDTSNPMTFRPGYLISWASGEYGHVAVIEEVIGDRITISEAWRTNPGIGHQTIRTLSKQDLITYQGKKQFICTIDLSSGRD